MTRPVNQAWSWTGPRRVFVYLNLALDGGEGCLPIVGPEVGDELPPAFSRLVR